jgi:hypothetical protein
MRILLLLVGVVMVATSVVLLLTAAPELPREAPTPAAPEAAAPTGEVLQQPPVEEPPTFLPRDLEVAPTREATGGPEPDPVARPTRIEVDAIGVDHRIVAVGLNPDGSMEIPHDVHELGWYEPGVMPGESGSAVIAGHVDSRAQGPGAFFDLRLLEAGDAIEITDESGTSRVWTVDRVVRYPKDRIPLQELFRWEGDSADLVLVTCGGAFDRTRRSYEDNIVVYASG